MVFTAVTYHLAAIRALPIPVIPVNVAITDILCLTTLGTQRATHFSIHSFPSTMSRMSYRWLSPADLVIDNRDLLGLREHLLDMGPVLVERFHAKDGHYRDALVRPVFRIPVVVILLVDLHIRAEDDGEQLQRIRRRCLVHWCSTRHLARVSIGRSGQLHQRAICASQQEEVISQLLAFPRGRNDDLIDALSFQVGKWDKPGPIIEKAPYNSFDYWKEKAKVEPSGWAEAMNL